ncbi:MAG TPA: HdeD family acid-resistance protein [Eoetvoesiella sp.]
MSELTPDDKHSYARDTHPLDAVRAKWKWFLGLGLFLLIVGFAASYHVLTATLVSVIFVGTLMLFAGVGMLINAWRVKGWTSFLFWTISGILYLGAGLLAFYNPLTGAAVLTLLLGATLIGSGAFRLWIWFQNRAQPGWQWLALSGIVTLLAGLAIAAGWPGNSVWVLGLLLAIDLIFQGLMLMMLGMALRRQEIDLVK